MRRERADAARKRLGQHCSLRVEPGRQLHERPPRNGDLLGEDPGTVQAEQLPGRAEIVLAGQAPVADAAGHQWIDRVLRPVDPADDLVAENERRNARPGMAPVAVQVGAADPCELDLEHDLVRSGLGLRQVVEAHCAVAVPDKRLHPLLLGRFIARS